MHIVYGTVAHFDIAIVHFIEYVECRLEHIDQINETE